MRLIPVGRVVATHGTRGEIRFNYYNDKDNDLLEYESFFLSDGTRLVRAAVRHQKGVLFLIKFAGLDSIGEASRLVNKELFVREQDLRKLEEGEFYEYQLIGLTVVNQRDEKIGEVTEVLHTGANDILTVRGASELLVPLVEGHVLEVDLARSVIRVDEEALV